MEQVKERKEFELGDFISKDEVLTREGSAKYRRMSDFCNDNHYVMKEDVLYESGGEPLPEGAWEEPIPIYRISEPDPPKPQEETPQDVTATPNSDAERIATLEKRLDDQTLLLADLVGGRI